MAKKESNSKNKKNQQTKDQPKMDKLIADNTKLELKLKWEEVKDQYDQILKKYAKEVKVEGFRQGKAPLKAAEKKIGRQKIISQTLQTLVPDKYQSLIKKEKKEPLTNPEIKPLSLDWGKDWELEINIAEKPEIKLGNYKQAIKKGLKEAKEKIKEQAEKIKSTQEKEDKSKTTKAKSKATSKKKAEKAENDKTEKTKTKEQLEAEAEQKKQQEKQLKLQQVFKSLVESIEPKIPELLLKEETKREIQRLAKELEQMGLSLDDYLERRQQSFEDMSSSLAAQTLGRLQLEFVLSKLEEELGIEVSETDEETELKKIEQPGFKEQLDKNPKYRDYFLKQIKRRKLLDQLLD